MIRHESNKSNKIMYSRNDNSLEFQGDPLFLMDLVHLACPGMQKKKKKQDEKIDGEGQQEKRLECHFMSISICLLDTVLRLSSVCVRQPRK